MTKFKVAWGTAREQVRLARSLEDMPATRDALDRGDLSMSATRVLVSARQADEEAFRRSEEQLVEAARIHSVGELGRVAGYWRQAVEREHALEGEEKLRTQRRLHASTSLFGMVQVDGTLDPESGETLLTALRAVMDAAARGKADDARTPAQRRADALTEICRQWLDGAERPTVAGERPHVTVMVGVHLLRGDSETVARGDAEAIERSGGHPAAARGGPGPCEMDHVGPVSPNTARRLACDASLTRIVMSGRSEPLDVGRRTPIVPPAMRRAVIARDRACRFPGCDRPHAWCDAHHVTHWTDGGPRRSRTCCCCAGATIGWCTTDSGWS